jgi:glutamyl-Q tRNA(Asp) synthetase
MIDRSHNVMQPVPERTRGRFAPSPTGPLHFGSLLAALASYVDAKGRGGEWLVRIEDLDPPREVPGAAGDILRTLDALGLEWEGQIRYQSRCTESYAAALEKLMASGAAYACACSRREIAMAARIGIDGPVYPGTCRKGIAAGREPRAWRVRVPAGEIELHDENFGSLRQDVAKEVGDFVLRRADGLFAYQLAVVVDDADQGITRVVRGADLLDSSQRQMLLQRLLGLRTPAYVHVPVAADASGAKLSKQTRARPVDPSAPSPALFEALRFLQQAPPAELARAQPREILQWAAENWSVETLPKLRTAPAPAEFR